MRYQPVIRPAFAICENGQCSFCKCLPAGRKMTPRGIANAGEVPTEQEGTVPMHAFTQDDNLLIEMAFSVLQRYAEIPPDRAAVDRDSACRPSRAFSIVADRTSPFRHSDDDAGDSDRRSAGDGHPAHSTRPPLPDPRLVRRMIRHRQLRARYFDNNLFADPAWDMLLDLTAARAEHRRVTVTSLCIASEVPTSTALRWISQMTAAGLLERVEDDIDRRRAFVKLSDSAADTMARYFAKIGSAATRLV